MNDVDVCNKIKPYIQPVLQHNFGYALKPAQAQVLEVYGGTRDYFHDSSANDINSLTLLLPCGKQNVTWSFTFNLSNLYEPPDVFSDDGFFEQLSVDILRAKVPCLTQWNPTKQQCFLELIVQFLDLYQDCQIDVLLKTGNFQRVAFEIETMCAVSEIDASQLKFYGFIPERGNPSIDVVVSLQATITSLPVSPPPPCIAQLTVEFKHYGDPKVDLILWKELENLIGTPPMLPPSAELPLLQYVELVKNVIQEKIDKVEHSIHLRRELLNALHIVIKPAVLDMDSELYTRLSFLLEDGHIQAMCNVDVAESYPSNKGVHLTVFKLNKNHQRAQPQNVRNFHYNDKWDPETAARKIYHAFLKDVFGINEGGNKTKNEEKNRWGGTDTRNDQRASLSPKNQKREQNWSQSEQRGSPNERKWENRRPSDDHRMAKDEKKDERRSSFAENPGNRTTEHRGNENEPEKSHSTTLPRTYAALFQHMDSMGE